ncbi:ATP-dependent helicase [bacterium]|nr:ATP-dependent helicase [bacterium]
MKKELKKVGWEALIEDLSRLNSDQMKVIKGFKGPSLVFAGPGTGKTRTMAALIGKLLRDGLRMKEVLALTFSDKAAKELRQRILSYYSESFDECWVSTFHSFCSRLLREQFHIVGLNPSFKLLTSFKEAVLMSKICSGLNQENFPIFGKSLSKRGFQLEALNFISLMKSNLLKPSEIREIVWGDCIPEVELLKRLSELTRIYESYEVFRENAGYLDFRDLIAYSTEVLKDPEASKRYRNQFKVVIIDEFQDTDPAQFLLLALLKGEDSKSRIAVIGDMFQSIYRFRGADPRMMAKNGPFGKLFRPRLFELSYNYRSAPVILKACGNLYKRFSHKNISKAFLHAVCNKPGFVNCFCADHEVDEARMIARKIASLLIYGESRIFQAKEIAILVRNNFQIDVIAESLKAMSVPFEILGDLKYFRSEEVMVLSSLFKISIPANQKFRENLFRLFTSPLFNIDQMWAQRIISAIRPQDDLLKLLEQLVEGTVENFPPVPIKERPAVESFLETIRCISSTEEQTVLSLLSKILFSMQKFLANPISVEARNIYHFRNMVGDFSEVVKHFKGEEVKVSELMKDFDALLLYYASTLETEPEAESFNGVRSMTIHQSKGLAFPVVVIPGLCDGLFPVESRENLLIGNSGLKMLQNALDKKPREVPFFNPYPTDIDDHLEEERRLMYVAMTRAQEGLILTFPRRLGNDPTFPSPFVSEVGLPLNEELKEKRPLTEWEIRGAISRVSPEQRTALKSQISQSLSSNSLSQCFEDHKFMGGKIDFIAPLEDFVFSSNSIQTYINCPRLFFFRFVLKIQDPLEENSKYSLFGQAMHSCLEALHHPNNPWFMGKNPTDDEWNAIWKKHGEPTILSLPFLEKLAFESEARKMFQKYRVAVFDRHQIPFTEKTKVEQDFSIFFRGFHLRGRVDRFVETSAGIWIIDYKTGSQMKSGNRLADLAFSEDSSPLEIQLPLYLLAFRAMGNMAVSAINLYLKSDLYRRKTENLDIGFLKSGALNLGGGPNWGIPIEEGRFDLFEKKVASILERIVQERVFDCKPLKNKDARTCLQLNQKGTPDCEFVSFCQERLEQLKVTPASCSDDQET